jgi:serine/threonine protein kinase
MHINPFIAVLGLSGGELILILLSLIVMCAVPIAAIVIIVWLWKRRTPTAADRPATPSPTKKICPQCRTEMAPDAPQGLCPQCLARAAFETQAPGATQQRSSAMPVSEVAKVFPQFEIIELLGQGGMGVVYKARQPQLDRFIALKILSPELSRDPAFAERFNREARALARLNHPNIVAVYESGKAGEFYYLVMEFVDGLNLSQMQLAKKRLAPEEPFAIVPKICDALQYAHDEGVVHRDIKPANILIDKKGRVKIADFGLAKMLGQDIMGLGLSQSRAMMGTPQYMAPEQLEKPLTVDHRADIYSLGVVFYEMLTGELPLGRFPNPSKKVRIDVRLDEIVLRTLEKEPELRYQQASELKTHVETVVSTPGKQSEPSSDSAKPADDLRAWRAQPKLVPGVSELWAKWPPKPRFTKVAIIGAIWAWFFIPILVSIRIEPYTLHGPAPLLGDFILTPWYKFVIIFIGIIAPMGTTLCGWVSIAQIRHSAGKLYGLGLGLFDALLFPLLLLNLGLVIFVFGMFVPTDSPAPRWAYPWWAVVLIVSSICVAIGFDCWIVSTLWRLVRKPVGTFKAL